MKTMEISMNTMHKSMNTMDKRFGGSKMQQNSANSKEKWPYLLVKEGAVRS